MKKKFEPPTIDEIRQYARSIGYKTLDPNNFWHSYNRIGWTVGKNGAPMISWKSAVWTWFCGTKEYKDMKAREIAKAKPPPEPEDPFEPADPVKVAAGKEKLYRAIKPAYYGKTSKAEKERRKQTARNQLLADSGKD